MNKRYLLRQITYSLSPKGKKLSESMLKQETFTKVDYEVLNCLAIAEEGLILKNSKTAVKLLKSGHIIQDKTVGDNLNYIYSKNPRFGFVLDTYLDLASGLKVREKDLDRCLDILDKDNIPARAYRKLPRDTNKQKVVAFDTAMANIHEDDGQSWKQGKDWKNWESTKPQIFNILSFLSKRTSGYLSNDYDEDLLS